MGKYVFTYNAVEKDDINCQKIRKEVVIFLNNNGATHIKQCLDSSFIFTSNGKSIEHWHRLILNHLSNRGNVLYDSYYLLNKIFYTKENSYEIKCKSNDNLQDFVDKTLADL